MGHESLARTDRPDSVNYPRSFLSWLAKRTPNVRNRLLRLNPLPWCDGERHRGYHPHRRSADPWLGYVGKKEFIRRFGRDAWATLPQCAIIQRGHRKAVSQETILDNLWLLPSDSPLRRAYRKDGQWCIPIQLPDGHMGPVVIRMVTESGAAPTKDPS
jgi:hypothetical protein